MQGKNLMNAEKSEHMQISMCSYSMNHAAVGSISKPCVNT